MLHSCGTETQVKDSRLGKDGILIRRRRHCPCCKIRFTTYEITVEEFSKLAEIKYCAASLKADLQALINRLGD